MSEYIGRRHKHRCKIISQRQIREATKRGYAVKVVIDCVSTSGLTNGKGEPLKFTQSKTIFDKEWIKYGTT